MIFQYPPLSELILKLQSIIPVEAQAHLVGGVVRDSLLGRHTFDVDFTLPVKAGEIGRKVAYALGAHFFCLDAQRETWRAIFTPPEGKTINIDFAVYRGDTLEDDLKARDFTINALAVPLHAPNQIIDVVHGLIDLKEKRLRACSPQAFENDAVRILRAIRLAFQLRFTIEKETRVRMRDANRLLLHASPERVRDELMKMLHAPSPDASLRALDTFGGIDILLPELSPLKGLPQSPPHQLDAWEHTLATMARLEDILEVLEPVYHEDKAANWHLGMISFRLGRYREQLHAHLERSINLLRPTRALLYLAALYHDSGKASSLSYDKEGRIHFIGHEKIGAELLQKRAATYNMSKKENEYLTRIVLNHLRPLFMANRANLPNRRSIYRYFKACHAAGVEVALLSLADLLAQSVSAPEQVIWRHQVDVVRTLWEAWWDKRDELVSPPLLLRGEEVMQAFNIPPGPFVGRLLEYLQEAQASGVVHTRAQALTYLKNRINNLPKTQG